MYDHKFGTYNTTHSWQKQPRQVIAVFILVILTLFCSANFYSIFSNTTPRSFRVPHQAAQILEKCSRLKLKPGPPDDFDQRKQSDRFELGTRPVLLRNATIWTGNLDGREVLNGDILMDKGMIKAIGTIEESLLKEHVNLVTSDIGGAWVTPGIVDLHSHMGVGPSPALRGTEDTNSINGLILPWLRSVDGLDTHDESYLLSISGGVTTALILPGSADAIGGQAYVIKLRPTSAKTTTAMLLEPPVSLNGTYVDPKSPLRWRFMKHACGENPSRVYGGTRMDNIWAMREGYNKARTIKVSQDQFCEKAASGLWDELGEYPEDLQWESLVDVLRGHVKVNVHCYEAVDFDDIVRLSNEFQFPISAFHHAHEAYLVPELLKSSFGEAPAVAMFATNARYKAESYRGSEFAPRLLHDNGLKVVMKSDHPVLNSRYLLYEAQQAHYYGLPPNIAIASVTSNPAAVMAQDHRIGYLRIGFDADVVIWDSHPLALGATPLQTYIDGIPQIMNPQGLMKDTVFQRPPPTPNFDKEAADALKYDGLPPLTGVFPHRKTVVFKNLTSIYIRNEDKITQVFQSEDKVAGGIAVIHDGSLACFDSSTGCLNYHNIDTKDWIDLRGGSLSPGLTTFGSPLGLEEIQGEPSTSDGYVDPLNRWADTSTIIPRAADGLKFMSRDALLAYKAGVTAAIVPPKSHGFFSGLSTAFSTSASHKLAPGGLVKEIAALHLHIGHYSKMSISTQLGVLRQLLTTAKSNTHVSSVADLTQSLIPLVIHVDSADVMASLISLKKEVKDRTGTDLKMVFAGGAEAHLIADEIGEAGIGVVLLPSRPFPFEWESRRILPGPPLTSRNAVAALLKSNVTVGIGITESWMARNTRFDVGWAALETEDGLSKSDALALASVNLEILLGCNRSPEQTDMIATLGGDIMSMESKVVAVISPSRQIVEFV